MSPAAVPLPLSALLLVLALACVPALPPVQRAFAERVRHQLLPGERIVMTICPDLFVLARWALALGTPLALLGLGLTASGADPALAVVLAGLPGMAGLAALTAELRKGWVATDRRLLSASGAALPLDAITRLEVAPTLLRVRAGPGRSLSIAGVVDAHVLARMLQSVAARASSQALTPALPTRDGNAA